MQALKFPEGRATKSFPGVNKKFGLRGGHNERSVNVFQGVLRATFFQISSLSTTNDGSAFQGGKIDIPNVLSRK